MTAAVETAYNIQTLAPLPDLWPSHMQNIFTISQESQQSYPIMASAQSAEPYFSQVQVYLVDEVCKCTSSGTAP